MVDEFPGNSRRIVNTPAARAEEENDLEKRVVEPVVTGKVIRRKKSLGKRFVQTFFSGNTNSVFGYLLRDVLVPALQATATDIVTQGIEKAVYGEVRSPHRSTRPGAPRSHISYDRYGTTARPSAPAPSTPTTNRRPAPRSSAYDMGEIVLETRMAAQDVLEGLVNILDQYDVVSVGDLNALLKQTSQHTDYKYGWVDLSEATIRRVREGYLLNLPEPQDLR